MQSTNEIDSCKIAKKVNYMCLIPKHESQSLRKLTVNLLVLLEIDIFAC